MKFKIVTNFIYKNEYYRRGTKISSNEFDESTLKYLKKARYIEPIHD